MEKLNVTPDDIAEKEFSVAFQGYSADEVDDYLDLILKDYEKMEKNIQELLDLITTLQGEVDRLNALNVELKGKANFFDLSNTTSYSSVDLLKRVSRLEEILSKQDENK